MVRRRHREPDILPDMLTPTRINIRQCFYPIGNTPAVNLLRDWRSCDISDGEQPQTVKILLLACGDPRSILFSLRCQDEQFGSLDFDITCCDLNPAILARNVFLFTFIADGDCDQDTLWNTFYHFYIPERELHLLLRHSAKLVQASESIDTWLSSPYGSLIRFLNHGTLLQMRKYWSLYAETREYSDAQTKEFELRVRSAISKMYELRKSAWTAHGRRSAGVMHDVASLTMDQAFKGFWRTGVVGGNRVDEMGLGNGGKGFVNPMFAISSPPTGDFAVYYGSDPLHGFHFAEAFDDGDPMALKTDQVVQLAKAQFRHWCFSFHRHFKSSYIRIRIFCGEAVRLCHELQSRNNRHHDISRLTRLYLGPWTSKPLAIDAMMRPSSPYFDIIDTSNLADHVGILNLLPAVAPLVSREPSSVLYTEYLLQASVDTSSALYDTLCSDVTTMSLVIGLAPVGHLLGVTTEAVGTESMTSLGQPMGDGKQKQHRLRIPWRVPGLGDSESIPNPGCHIGFDADQLAEYFFKLYLQMFTHEYYSRLTEQESQREVTSPLATDLRYYSRISLVALLWRARTNVVTHWHQFMDKFLSRVEGDCSLIVGTHSLQELYLYLHVFGLRENPLFRIPRHLFVAQFGALRPASGEKGVLAKNQLPPIVFITLVVPREDLGIFTSKSPDAVGTPGLHLFLASEKFFDNSFFGIQCFFGRLKTHMGSNAACDVEEDGRGWMGDADLIVICPVPAFMLLIGPQEDIRVGLQVSPSPSTGRFLKDLGDRMVIYECGLDSEKHLRITEEVPGIPGAESLAEQLQAGVAPDIDGPVNQQHSPSVRVNLDQEYRARDVQIRIDIPIGSEESTALSNGAKVAVRPNSPCTLLLEIEGGTPRHLVYPFPIDGSVTRTRVARKSSWIEVATPLSPSLVRGGYNSNPFPVATQDGGLLQTTAWGHSRVILSQQPTISITGGRFDWLDGFMGSTFSAMERARNRLKADKQPADGMLDLKKSLNVLFQSFVDRNPNRGPTGNFLLACKHKNYSYDTILLATSLRHDHDTGSILLDAYVIPLTKLRFPLIGPAVQGLANTHSLRVTISGPESMLWKHLLPALVERCRHGWTHKQTCEYRVQNRIPLSTEYMESPICSCGEGKSMDGFPMTRSECVPFAKYATRIAISPVFFVPYVEPMVSKGFEEELRLAVQSLEMGAEVGGD
ncbi:MAG: hypothetical protein M1840_005207 [Geoglossum simile]|nr:MAG: hypothetical protein M1840_005207 [Geoglossum simile]